MSQLSEHACDMSPCAMFKFAEFKIYLAISQ